MSPFEFWILMVVYFGMGGFLSLYVAEYAPIVNNRVDAVRRLALFFAWPVTIPFVYLIMLIFGD